MYMPLYICPCYDYYFYAASLAHEQYYTIVYSLFASENTMKKLILNNIEVFLSSARIIESISKQLDQYRIKI